jgi:nucleoside-diphosphate-sugar epimerase
LLVRGKNKSAYNVGSSEETSIYDLACMVASVGNPKASIIKLGADTIENTTRYVPSTEKIESELGIQHTVLLKDSITRTIRWYHESRNS